MENLPKKVLTEDNKLIKKVRRRLSNIDDEVKSAVITTKYQHTNICFGEQAFFETVLENAIDNIYYTYFSDIDDDSKEWYDIYKLLVKYIEEKYIFKIQQFYHMQCGD